MSSILGQAFPTKTITDIGDEVILGLQLYFSQPRQQVRSHRVNIIIHLRVIDHTTKGLILHSDVYWIVFMNSGSSLFTTKPIWNIWTCSLDGRIRTFEPFSKNQINLVKTVRRENGSCLSCKRTR